MKLLFIVLSLVIQFWNTEGTCRCLDQTLCGDAVSGCNYRCQPGFTGKNCQHDNLGYMSARNAKKLFDGDHSTCLRLPSERKIYFTHPIDVDTIRVHRENNQTGKFYHFVLINTRRVTLWRNYGARAEGPTAATHFPLQTGVTAVRIDSMGMACEVELTNANALATESPHSTSVPVCDHSHCNHGGTCYNQEGEPVCECTARYTGTQCETALATESPQTALVPVCNTYTCHRRGTCYNQQGIPVCNCTAGYTGTQCETELTTESPQTAAPSLVCNLYCSGRGTCKNKAGKAVCECQAGYTGAYCREKCRSGYYGANCTMSCNEGCQPQHCHHVTGDCRCRVGWTGQRCETDCAESGQYGYGCRSKCSEGCNSGTCDRVIGRCSCKPGWRGDKCSRKCEQGRYGRQCQKTCGPNCRTCHYVTGSCGDDCESGWFGENCDKRCSRNFYGSRCIQRCAEGCVDRDCDHVDGRCACKPGWIHNKCSEKCWKGFHGSGCTQRCAAGCKDGNCNHVDGSCVCKPGLRGHKCSEKCSPGFYGANCGESCNEGCKQEHCNHVNGDCNYKCRDGWTGWRCDTECSQGSYGSECTERCAAGCEAGDCNHVDGSCVCKPGWRDYKCSEMCLSDFYGPGCVDSCSEGCEGGTCHHVSGNCSCKNGWTGEKCSEQCPRGKFGPGCAVSCSEGCVSDKCHPVSGNCSCRGGWTGNSCSNKCLRGTYGRDCHSLCSEGCEGGTCHHVSGNCDCKDGWKGEKCSEPCVSGVYGESCSSNCSEGCVNKSCNRSNGACGDCLIGWTHSDKYLRCDKKCDNGTFGKGCVEQCSVNCQNWTCHFGHGACLLGCNEGWEGDTCQEHQAVVSQNGLMYASLVLVLLLVALVVVLLVVFRNRIKDCLFTATDRADDNNIPMTGRKAAVIDHVSFADENVVRNNDETVYANQPDSASSTCVTIAGLKDYVTRKREKKKTLLDEYAKLPQGLITAYDIALTDENNPKNRFREIYPYNHSLVHIKTATGKPGYINASFIDGPMREKQYIATQGPLPHTVEDFLEMIWQYNIAVVVMLANIVEDGKKRCEQYWPHEVNVPVLTFGYINVSVADECSYADFTVRTLHLRKGRLSRSVKHVHYTVWPDKGVPDDTISLIALRHKVRSLWDLDTAPLVVHCSAGVGRTGTLMALDYLMEQADHQNRVDIFGCVWTMRGNRVKMVQTDIQYVFLHDCLLDALVYTRPPVQSSVFLKEYNQLKKDSSTELAKKYKHLEETPVPDRPHTVATNNENSNKNRTMDILPGDLHRVYLMYPVPGHTDYINAVMAPSFRRRSALIMTQTPLVTTVVDLWRLIKDHNVRGLVLLDNYTAADEGCGVFWADEGQSCSFGPFSITRGKTEQHTGFSVEDYEYKTNESEGSVSLFRCSFWPQQSSLPESDSRLLCFLDFIRQWDSGKSPLVVICRNGCTRSGLYCVLSNVLERLVLEKEVAINNAIRRLRLVRKQVIPTLEQFEFCHDAVKTYIESFHDYTNM